MSKYTTEVRFLCESLTGHEDSVGYNDVDSVIQEAIPIIFSFDFPIFDEEYRSVLETKILRHYYTREIGLETYGLWKLKLETKLNEIMPYYNKLYESELLKYDPLRDVDMTTTHSGVKKGTRSDVNNTDNVNSNNATHNISETIESSDDRHNEFVGGRSTKNNSSDVGNASSQGGNTSTDMDLYSDTPQGALTGVENGTYLTNARKMTGAGTNSNNTNTINSSISMTNTSDVNSERSKGNSNSTNSREESVLGNDSRKTSSVSSGTTNNTEDYVMHVFGKAAGTNYAKLIKEFRDNLLNIDMDVIKDLADLFMLIW